MNNNLVKVEQLSNQLFNCLNQAINIAEMTGEDQLLNEVYQIVSVFNADMAIARANPSEITDSDVQFASDLVQECLQDLSELNAS